MTFDSPDAAQRSTSATQTKVLHDFDMDNVLTRIGKLEAVVFKTSSPSFTNTTTTTSPQNHVNVPSSGLTCVPGKPLTDASSSRWTPIELNVPSVSHINNQVSNAHLMTILRRLPSRSQATALLDHFVRCVQPTFCVLHVPSIRQLVDNTYQAMMAERGKQQQQPPSGDALALSFSIFSGATLTWTPDLLGTLGTTPQGAKEAFATYTDVAVSLSECVGPSTVSLQAISLLVHILTGADGFGEKVHQLRSRGFFLARTMQLHRLDTPQNRDARRREGYDEVELEVQRRIWWNMATSDWLLAFSGGPQEGTYIFQLRHMNVNHPRNIDDELLTRSSGQEVDGFSASTPTSMSYLLHRLYLADICRQVVDTLPSVLMEPQELNYDVVVTLDGRFQNFIKFLPAYFQLEPQNMEAQAEIMRNRPYIAWQRATLHLSVNTYICRLHRPFHLESFANPAYAFSRTMCVRSAHKVLDMRRSMDDIGHSVGLDVSRLWSVAQHVFLAAITLAAEVSFNPGAPLADLQRAEVLEACRMLGEMRSESNAMRHMVQKGVQVLLAMLENSQQHTPSSQATSPVPTKASRALGGGGEEEEQQEEEMSFAGAESVRGTPLVSIFNPNVPPHDAGDAQDYWGQLWTEFFSTSPEWDVPQWNSLLEDIDWSIGPAL